MDFRFEYRPGTIRYGDGRVATLGAELDALDAENALVAVGRIPSSLSAAEAASTSRRRPSP